MEGLTILCLVSIDDHFRGRPTAPTGYVPVAKSEMPNPDFEFYPQNWKNTLGYGHFLGHKI